MKVEIPQALSEFVTKAKLVDMLDFSRIEFDKSIFLSPKKNIIVIGKQEWQVKLGDIAKVIAGQSPKSENYNENKNGLAFFQGKKDFGKLYLNDPEVWTLQVTKESIKNDLLMSVRAPVGTVNINPFDKICIGRGIAAIRSNNMQTQKYLYELASTFPILFQGNTGAIFDSISTDDLRAIKIPLPPLEIQEKIINACESVDFEVQKANESIKKLQSEIEKEISSVDEKMVKLSRVIDIIGGGTPKTSTLEYWNGEIPWLSVVDFNNEHRFVSTTEKTITQKGLDNSSTKLLQKGDLIISARGTVGAVAELTIPMAFNQSCYGLRPHSEIDRGFLYYMIIKEVKQLKDNAYGSTFDSITTRTFDSILIPLPSMGNQKILVEKLEKLEKKIGELKAIINQASNKKEAILKEFL